MTITYANGASVEALLMARGNDYLRAAVPGDDDLRTFHLVSGTWFSEAGEVVKLEFVWQQRHGGTADVPPESECICPKELASHLMAVLLAGGERDDLFEDMLYVLSPAGKDVRVEGKRLRNRRAHEVVLSA